MVTMNLGGRCVIAERKISNYSLYEKQSIIIDLLTQLAVVLEEKAKVENENSNLKLEKQKLNLKCAELEQNITAEKKLWMNDMIDSHMRVQEKETILAKKDIERLEEQKRSLLEINNLKLSFYEQRDVYELKLSDLGSQIKCLENQVKYIESVYDNVKSYADVNYHKYIIYKKKVKCAVNAITELMQELKKYKKISSMVAHEACQTDFLEKSSQTDK